MSNPPRDATPIRLGLIGCGYVSRYHVAAARALDVRIAAVCDRKADAAKALARELDARAFVDPAALIASDSVDAVIVATPHFAHAAIALAALQHGLHVLCEKPLVVSASEGRRLVAAYDALPAPRPTFAVNFNQRTWPLWRHVKHLLDRGELGSLVRYSWTIADWYRSQRYYDESTWRGTWAGEGGGLLVNQCAHQLDLLCWLFGRPTRVMASVRRGKHHDIETEDEVHALLEHDDALVGTFVASTGEPLGEHHLEIVGDLGLLRVRERGQIEHVRFDRSARDLTAAGTDRAPSMGHSMRVTTVDDHRDEYRLVLSNFVDACRGLATPLASARDALGSVELANAILLSGIGRSSVTLPADAAQFDATLARLQCEAPSRGSSTSTLSSASGASSSPPPSPSTFEHEVGT